MSKSLSIAIVTTVLMACGGTVDCPTKADYNSCGYCSEDRMTSSNPHAGMCTYCPGVCGGDPCNPVCGGGGGSCDSSWVSSCGKTTNGVQFIGAPHPKACGNCPAGTYDSGDDNVTAGGPYNICTCNGF